MTTLHIPRSTEIETYTGKWFDFDNPDSGIIDIEDIAHSLSNICRFQGHVKRYYSVAEHAVIAYTYAKYMNWTEEQVLACFHHDDAEAYLGDIVRPFKYMLGRRLKKVEEKINAAICDGLGLPFGPEEFHEPYVKEADNWALMKEAQELMPSQGLAWQWDEGVEFKDGPQVYIGLDPYAAKRLYLYTNDRLTK